MVGAGQGRPIEVGQAVAAMAGNERHAGGMVAMGQRETRRRGSSGRGSHAGDDLHRDGVGAQVIEFFAATGENGGIAAWRILLGSPDE